MGVGGYIMPDFNPVNVSSGAVTSGDIQSGSVNWQDIASGNIIWSHLTSGAINSGHVANMAVVSGSVASGAIGFPHLANASVQSGTVASGFIFRFHLASGALVSGQLANASVVSGSIASGQLSTEHASSGFTAPRAQGVTPVLSGGFFPILTEETISGVRAVSFTRSGTIRIASASLSGLRPAFGIVVDNVASGIQANVYNGGFLQLASGMADFSGYVGRRAWLGRSGQIVATSGSFGSGGWASGDMGQCLGFIANTGAIVVQIATTLWSGGPLGEITAEQTGGLL